MRGLLKQVSAEASPRNDSYGPTPRHHTMAMGMFAAIAMTCAAGGTASANGLNLAWDDCYFGGGRALNNDACDTSQLLVISVGPSAVLTDINGAQGTIEINFEAGDIPDYWRFDAGGCRQGVMGIEVFNGSTTCPEPWSQVGSQVAAFNVVPYASSCNNRMRIQWIIAVPAPHTVVLDPAVSTEWTVMGLRIANRLTDCPGCSVSACLVAEQVRLTRPIDTPGGDYFITGADVSQHAAWRNPQGCPGTGHSPDCPVPVRDATWGQIKGMYR